MKVVLIQPYYHNIWESAACAYLAGYLKRHEPGLEMEFFQGHFDDDATILAGCADADIVGFSNTSPTFNHSVKLARAIKAVNPKVWTVTGGYHPSAVREKALVGGIDQVVVGEGEAAMLEIVRGDRRKLVFGRKMEFDELPWPDREFIKSERCLKLSEDRTTVRMTSFQSHRACPFTCAYCLDGFNKALYPGLSWKGKDLVRHRDIEECLDELEIEGDVWNVGLWKVNDPTWNVDSEWCTRFCERKATRGIKTPFYPMVHAGKMTERLAFAMAEAGCAQAAVGCESGSDKILKDIGKGTTVKSIKRCFGYLKAAGVKTRAFFILGMDDETLEDIAMTERLAEELEPDELGFTVLCPYPGVRQYSEEKFGGLDWTKADEYSSEIWSNNHLSNDQLRAEQERLSKRFQKTLNWHQQSLLASEGRITEQAPRAFSTTKTLLGGQNLSP